MATSTKPMVDDAIEHVLTFAPTTGRYTNDAAYRALRHVGFDAYDAACLARRVALDANHLHARLNPPSYATRKALRDATLAIGREK